MLQVKLWNELDVFNQSNCVNVISLIFITINFVTLPTYLHCRFEVNEHLPLKLADFEDFINFLWLNFICDAFADYLNWPINLNNIKMLLVLFLDQV